MSQVRVYIGSDHGGFLLKEEIKKYLGSKDFDVVDLGTNSEESVDYPKFGHAVGRAVVENINSFGIVVCGTGIGISIAANKIKGVRAALCHSKDYAKLSREHNDANVLALGGRFLNREEAIDIVVTFLSTKFEGDRHIRRVNQIENEV